MGLVRRGIGLKANHVGRNTSHRKGYKMMSAKQWFLGKFNVNRPSCNFQRCESDVPCDRLMIEAYTSYRRSPLDFSVPGQ